MRRALGVLVVLVVLAIGCTGADEEPGAQAPPSVPATVPGTAAPTENVGEPEPTEEPVLPLTGLPAADASVLERPVLAVKIDNAGAARPQEGLDAADIVVEELVEGGTTRFIALYHSTDPDVVGPVRSGREVDALLLPPFEPLLALSGAAAEVYADFREAGLTTFEEAQGPAAPAFFRSDDRVAPHNLYLRPSGLRPVVDDLPPAEQPWPIDARSVRGGQRVDEANIKFSPAASAAWTWEADPGVWLREQDGGEHVTASGEKITATNVVLLRVTVKPGDRTDGSGNRTADIAVIGRGDMILLRDGRAYEGQWVKESADDQFQFVDADGDPIPLAPGGTWIELIPTDGSVDLSGPDQEAGDSASDAGQG